MPTKITVLARRMLQVLEQPDDLTREQPVGAARVRLTGLVRQSLRPRLCPSHRLAREIGDAVDEDDALGCDHLNEIGIAFAPDAA